jgi:hypothetical protein
MINIGNYSPIFLQGKTHAFLFYYPNWPPSYLPVVTAAQLIADSHRLLQILRCNCRSPFLARVLLHAEFSNKVPQAEHSTNLTHDNALLPEI